MSLAQASAKVKEKTEQRAKELTEHTGARALLRSKTEQLEAKIKKGEEVSARARARERESAAGRASASLTRPLLPSSPLPTRLPVLRSS